ncbi:MAG: N-6 DNA methylase [Lachnospiraceae bacterium]|nr:N-6 DNA methylase [Lachnospiraceae bacterium]
MLILLKGGVKMAQLNIGDFSFRSSDFENSLNEDCRKKNGIFYTDVPLAIEIIKELKISPDSVILDPCCGTGSFLYAAITSGCDNVYGADLIDKAVKLCKSLTSLSTLKTYDTLGKKGKDVLKALGLKEKADYTVGNPPYALMEKDMVIDTDDYDFLRLVKDAGNNLFIAAIYRAFELTKDDGFISYIIPKNFLHVRSYSLLRREILNNKRIVSIIDIGAYFSGVRGEQIVLTLQNSLTHENKIVIKCLDKGGFVERCTVPQAFYKDEILLFKSEEEYSIYCKMQKPYKKFSDICTGYVGRGRSTSADAVTGKNIRKFGFKDGRVVPQKGNQVFIQNIYSAESGIIASFAGKYEASQTVTIFTDGDEKMCRYIVGILHSRLCNFYLFKFCYNSSKLTMHTDRKYLANIPLVKDDTTKEFSQLIEVVKALEKLEYMGADWFDMLDSLNELVYKIYGIDDNEAAYIDAEMFSIQSKRWANGK